MRRARHFVALCVALVVLLCAASPAAAARLTVSPVAADDDVPASAYAYIRAAAARRGAAASSPAAPSVVDDGASTRELPSAAASAPDDLELLSVRPPPAPLAVDSPEAAAAAAWALGALRELSDSTVFRTLSLAPRAPVRAAWAQAGAFHDAVVLRLALASPGLLDGDAESVHTLVVLTDREDGVQSLAIDEFPLFEPDAVEAAWRQKVDAARALSEIEFRKLDWEAAAWAEMRTRRAAAGGGAGAGADECVDVCDERAEAAGNFTFARDAELEALEAEEALALAAAARTPDLAAFLAGAPERAAERAARAAADAAEEPYAWEPAQRAAASAGGEGAG